MRDVLVLVDYLVAHCDDSLSVGPQGGNLRGAVYSAPKEKQSPRNQAMEENGLVKAGGSAKLYIAR